MDDQPTYLLVPEVAKIARTSESTIRQWIADGRLKASRPGRHVLIKATDLDKLLHTPRQPSTFRGAKP
jgi:excisionase family DNA binding protein